MRTRQAGCERGGKGKTGGGPETPIAQKGFITSKAQSVMAWANVGKPRCGEWDAVVLDLNRALPASKWISLLP